MSISCSNWWYTIVPIPSQYHQKCCVLKSRKFYLVIATMHSTEREIKGAICAINVNELQMQIKLHVLTQLTIDDGTAA